MPSISYDRGRCLNVGKFSHPIREVLKSKRALPIKNHHLTHTRVRTKFNFERPQFMRRTASVNQEELRRRLEMERNTSTFSEKVSVAIKLPANVMAMGLELMVDGAYIANNIVDIFAMEENSIARAEPSFPSMLRHAACSVLGGAIGATIGMAMAVKETVDVLRSKVSADNSMLSYI